MLGVLGLVVVAPFALTAPLPAGHVMDVAERFKPVGYTATRQNVEPRRLWCLGDNKCPSAYMAWDFDKVITNDQLTGWLRAAGYDTAIEGECADLRLGVGIRCWADGSSDGQDIRLNVNVDPTARTSTINLSVS
ncbi:MAG TPA: hypothetical protein VFW79_05845 [Cellulomonas sp.]|uniref:hypothetical protein n=1 Tax=Cellulomonas sp. TaxID=40001 RepID=UPI002E36FE98|nr:hypothetical protein [Cellulomonas sp.]HEX5332147.1 hypothetical protein [Cellulomonas sp.]